MSQADTAASRTDAAKQAMPRATERARRQPSSASNRIARRSASCPALVMVVIWLVVTEQSPPQRRSP